MSVQRIRRNIIYFQPTLLTFLQFYFEMCKFLNLDPMFRLWFDCDISSWCVRNWSSAYIKEIVNFGQNYLTNNEKQNKSKSNCIWKVWQRKRNYDQEWVIGALNQKSKEKNSSKWNEEKNLIIFIRNENKKKSREKR